MNPNDPTPGADKLSIKQWRALDSLLLGKTITETAAEVGVDRSTIRRWFVLDFDFQAEYARRRNEFVRTIDNQLRRLAHKAIAALETALDAGKASAALALLKGLGLLTGKRPQFEHDIPSLLEGRYIDRVALVTDLNQSRRTFGIAPRIVREMRAFRDIPPDQPAPNKPKSTARHDPERAKPPATRVQDAP
ncbi:MAG: hypothetical protein JXQ73_03960 [Phycisphaerae bacterium]|nr:hypothetical protein [Phycisphaerae bacterium]